MPNKRKNKKNPSGYPVNTRLPKQGMFQKAIRSHMKKLRGGRKK